MYSIFSGMQTIKQRAIELGFDLVGVSKLPIPNQKVSKVYQAWLDQNMGASMDYLKRHAEKKLNPKLNLENAKSVISLAVNYACEMPKLQPNQPKISMYTADVDYHEKLSQMLEQLKSYLENEYSAKCFTFVDIQPVLDRFWAFNSGIGWFGKNTNIINRKIGSYLFLCGVITDLDLEQDSQAMDHCGKCRKCIEACPTEAIQKPTDSIPRFHIDSNKCIAYHTIENKEEIPNEIQTKMKGWIAGCDICQQVCPWNQPVQKSKNFKATNPALSKSFDELESWNEEKFKTDLKPYAMSRMKYSGFKRNLKAAKNSI